MGTGNYRIITDWLKDFVWIHPIRQYRQAPQNALLAAEKK
jgi:hypothetical protein